MTKRRLSNKYGHFTAGGREFLITTPRTPRPWINVISNGDYGFTVSQTGSGYSWRAHAQLNRITRWEQDLVKDEWGKYVYIQDDAGHIWSAGWKPVCAEPERYVCVHGLGRTTIESVQYGIGSSMVMFVPNDDPVEIWHLTLRNRSHRERRLKLYTYLEWGLGVSPDWHREFHKSFIETSYDPAAHSIMAVKRVWEVPTDRGHWNVGWPYVAFHSSSVRPSSFETDKQSFLGMYGDVRSPAGVTRGTLQRNEGNGLDPIGSLLVKVVLKPGEEKSVVFCLGAADSAEQAGSLSRKYSDDVVVRQELAKVERRWEQFTSTTEVETPEPAMDVMENVWLKYQAISCRMWARTAYYQTGGAFGFRDQLQDSQIWLPIDASRTRTQLLLHAAHQFADGTVYHWWHPLTEQGLRNQISDNLLWLPFVLKSYLDETADVTVLDAAAAFVDDRSPAPLYDHCTRAIAKALDRFSDRGLPLIGSGDWNDGLSAVGIEMKGESVWLGHFLYKILLDFGEIAERRGDVGRGVEYRNRAANLREALNTHGWDGEAYYGATKDSGEEIGSRANKEGSLWLNPQTWAIIAGVADGPRGAAIFDVIESRLETEIGPLLLAPAYKTPDKFVGYLTRYAPGMRENGGVYTHGATWAVIAAAMLGKGEAAYRIYAKLNPVNRAEDPDRYAAEPYVTSGNIEGPDSKYFGRGGWTWYSGSAAWLCKVGFEWILGIRPTYDGLVVDPCIPRSWKGFKVRRVFRGATYAIEVRNPHHAEHDVAEVIIDGSAVAPGGDPRRTLLPVFPAGTSHTILVVLGKQS